jgi:hypothetical protein
MHSVISRREAALRVFVIYTKDKGCLARQVRSDSVGLVAQSSRRLVIDAAPQRHHVEPGYTDDYQTQRSSSIHSRRRGKSSLTETDKKKVFHRARLNSTEPLMSISLAQYPGWRHRGEALSLERRNFQGAKNDTMEVRTSSRGMTKNRGKRITWGRGRPHRMSPNSRFGDAVTPQQRRF